jgi:outer membrane protein TolC
LSVALVFASPAYAEEVSAPPEQSASLPGTNVEGVLRIARQLSPELVARALQADAARARVDIAGSLPDPTLRITSDEIDRVNGPRQNKMIYSIEQEVPLWGKLDLRKAVALAEVERATAQSQSAELELAEKVKVAFAAYYQAEHAVKAGETLHRAIHAIAKVARDRYAQGIGSQQEVFQAEIERSRIDIEVVRLDITLKNAQGQLNALLLRPLNAPLAEPRTLRSVPGVAQLDVNSLAARAISGNPSLRADLADVKGAATSRELAERNWYPDVTVSAGGIDRGGNGPNGYMASIGFQIPLQWGLHEAQTREATAALGAARAEHDARNLEIQSGLVDAVSALQGARRTADLYRTQLLPQGEALLRSTTAAFSFGKLGLSSALQAEHDLYDLRVQLLATELDEQRQLAAIERLIGEDL